MKEITPKTIKKFILDPTNDLDNLYDYLTTDYKTTIDGLFSALYKLLIKNYSQNKSRSDYLISILDSLIVDATTEELSYLASNIRNITNNIYSNLKKKEIIKINEAITSLSDLHNKISNQLISNESNSNLKLIEYLIFNDKNLVMVENIINTNRKLLYYTNQEGDDIFSVILKKYLYLNETNQNDIDYLYRVILLFIESNLGHEILKNKKKYQRIIRQSKQEYKEHLIKVIEIFDHDFKISLEELEERYDKKFSFPNILNYEINTFTMNNTNRHNFTYQNCIAIDGENTRCIDDALYIEENFDGTYNLYIHIADVSAYVPYNSLINEEAKKRVETLYLRDTNIELYPELISNRVCSLLPNNNRNVITYIFKLDSKCQLIDDCPDIVKGKIKVAYKLSCNEVDKIINNLSHSELDFLLSHLYLFSLNQKKSNPNKEAYRIIENYLEFKPHHESLKVEHSPAANIVHESMILANYGISKIFKELDLPYMYRKLYIPTDDFINEQIEKLKNLDERIGGDEAFRNNLKSCYSKAIYTNKPVFHKGLNLSSYSHSSSPLRRYSDAYGQYLIYEFLFNNSYNDLTIQTWEHRTQEIIKYINKQKETNEVFSKHYNYLSYKKLIKTPNSIIKRSEK